MQYCSLQHWTLLLSPVPSASGYCFCSCSISSFFLELFLHWSPVAYGAPTNLGAFIFQCPIFFAFPCCSWGSQGKNIEVVCHSLLQWTTFCQTSPPWPIRLGWPHTACSFIELDKAVVHVIRLASCLWLWFQSVCPLMPSLSAYCLTWVSLTLDVGYLFMAAPAKCSLCSLPCTWGSSSLPLLHHHSRCSMPKKAQTTAQLHSSHTLLK